MPTLRGARPCRAAPAPPCAPRPAPSTRSTEESVVPTYAYACTSCDHRMEVKQSFSDDALTVCPECQGRLRKRFDNVGVVFKGSGFYRNDSRGSAPKDSSSSSSSTSSSSASKDSSSSTSSTPASTPSTSSSTSSSTGGSSSGSSSTSSS